jgi:acetyl esterase/lipase
LKQFGTPQQNTNLKTKGVLAQQEAKLRISAEGNRLKKIWVLLGAFLLCISILVIYISLENLKLADENPDGDLLPEITSCKIQRGIPYAQDANPYHLMNAYIPEGDGPFPVIVYIHGGGWTSGHRDSYDIVGPFYARRGIAGFSIDYTLTAQDKPSWPQAIQDVILAIRHIRENSAQYRIDPDRFAVMGDSAGGHLASLVGTLSGNESFLAENAGNLTISSRVSLVIEYYGPTDFQVTGECGPNCNPYGLVEKFLGETYEMNQSRWLEASPATYITADDPIFIIAHGTNDTIVPITISESFISKLDAVGVENFFVKAEGGVHGFTDKENTIVRYVLEPLLKQVFNLQ